MKVEQIYTGCLAQGAYYIESEGEAVVIDPLRDIKPYLQRAESSGVKIKYVLETHFHADFVSGHVDLAKAAGAEIIFGPNAQPGYHAHIAKDGEELQVGRVKIQVLHTPGHTLESTCYLLKDESGKDYAIFTGDTLFIGDVGRPDLAQKASADLSKEKLATYLYRSLREKIMTLEDEVIVYPGHGAGSACGKKMSKETVSTIGEQKKSNYALRGDMSADEFVNEVLDGLEEPPAYFPENVMMNISGYQNIDEVIGKGMNALEGREFEVLANEVGALVLDTRAPEVFAEGFVPGSINIGIDGGFAPWVGTLIPDIKQAILIVADKGREEEVVTRLARVGYDNTIGFLKGGIEGWQGELETIKSINAEELAEKLQEETIDLIDVRKESEFSGGHATVARNLPLDQINKNMAAFDKDRIQYIHCAAGYRSMIAASILKSRGFDNIINISGGYKDISNAGIELSHQEYPSNMS